MLKYLIKIRSLEMYFILKTHTIFILFSYCSIVYMSKNLPFYSVRGGYRLIVRYC